MMLDVEYEWNRSRAEKFKIPTIPYDRNDKSRTPDKKANAEHCRRYSSPDERSNSSTRERENSARQKVTEASKVSQKTRIQEHRMLAHYPFSPVRLCLFHRQYGSCAPSCIFVTRVLSLQIVWSVFRYIRSSTIQEWQKIIHISVRVWRLPQLVLKLRINVAYLLNASLQSRKNIFHLPFYKHVIDHAHAFSIRINSTQHFDHHAKNTKIRKTILKN